MKTIWIHTKEGLSYHEIEATKKEAGFLEVMNSPVEFVGFEDANGAYHIYKKSDIKHIEVK